MRRCGQLFDTTVSTVNLWRGWRTFCRGKRSRPSVRAFEVEADRHLIHLHRELAGGTYEPQGYRLLLLRAPKRRLIAAAPVRDRVVHHAVHRQLAPRLDPRLIATTYACLPGRGSHRAVLAFLAALRSHRFALCLDVRHYFLTIDRRILMDLMRRSLKDARLLRLLRTIMESGARLYQQPEVMEYLGLPPGFPPPGSGLPIGNLTSQWWGNHYLSGLDHFVKRDLRVPHYQRYMDDLTLFADSRPQLAEAREAVAHWLWQKRRLRLKHPSSEPRSTRRRFTYLGFRVSRAGLSPTRDLLRRLQRRVAQVVLHGDSERIARSIAAYQGIFTFPGGPTTR